MNSTAGLIRTGWATFFALVLALRFLTPFGFMPAFDHGTLTFVACPGDDAEPMEPMRGMHHDDGKTCQSCPHATAAGAGLIDRVPLPLAAVASIPAKPILDPALLPPSRDSEHDRPPPIGPPFPA